MACCTDVYTMKVIERSTINIATPDKSNKSYIINNVPRGHVDFGLAPIISNIVLK